MLSPKPQILAYVGLKNPKPSKSLDPKSPEPETLHPGMLGEQSGSRSRNLVDSQVGPEYMQVPGEPFAFYHKARIGFGV